MYLDSSVYNLYNIFLCHYRLHIGYLLIKAQQKNCNGHDNDAHQLPRFRAKRPRFAFIIIITF